MSHDAEMQQRTDRALRTLTHAEAPACMQVRLTERVRAERTKNVQRVLWAKERERAGWIAAAAIVVFAACFVSVHRHSEKSAVPIASLQHQPVQHQETAANIPSVAPRNTSLPFVLNPRKSQPVNSSGSMPLQTPLRSQVPPPLPLTDQERLLITLARTPSLAASIAVSEPVSNHGLGPNTLRGSDDEQPAPLPAAPLEFTPLSPQPFDSSPTGEDQ